MPENEPKRQTALPVIFTLLSLFLLSAFMLSRFNLDLLFSDTILTGGDSASWYQILHTLKNEFLPHGRLFSYSNGNFFGYLEGQHYFPLPFLAAALAGFFIPLTVALKLATVVGGFVLPLTSFAAAYVIQKNLKRSNNTALFSGLLSACGSLVFLFNESYTIFGGNWLSTFAGEFCYSWAIALLPLFVASVLLDHLKKRSGILSGILLGILGLCHLFVFMPAFFLPFFPVFRLFFELIRGKKKENVKARYEKNALLIRVLITYGIAFMLMAFWMLPMVATRKWAQPISMIWHFPSFKEFVRQTLMIVWLPALLLFLVSSVRQKQTAARRSTSEAKETDIATEMSKINWVYLPRFLLYTIVVCAFLFLVAPGLGMPDIRFVPTAIIFSLFGISLLAANPAVGVAERIAWRFSFDKRSSSAHSRSGTSGIATLLIAELTVVLASCGIALTTGRNAPSWFVWNYSGYEAKQEWQFINKLRDTYNGSIDDGQFLWEKQDQRDNRDFGSERAFENLYLFTGHPSSEGIHYGSSFMARTATYLQSTYSLHPVDPEAERIYSTIDPDSWTVRFALLNVHYIIVHSDEMKKLFSAHPSFALDMEAGKFAVYRFKGYQGHYVQELPADAFSIVKSGPGGFKTDFYRFFRDYELIRFPFISTEFADSRLLNSCKGHTREFSDYDSYRAALLPQALIYGYEPKTITGISAEHVDNFSISFHTEKPGQPHLISLSYAPGWKSLSGEKIYPVSPGFMLIIPTTQEVSIRYVRTIWEWLGIFMTIFTVPLVFWIRIRTSKSRYRQTAPAISWKILTAFAMAVFLLSAVILILNTAMGYPALARDIQKARSLTIGQPEQRKLVLKLTETWATGENLGIYDNMLVFDACRIRAMALEREGKTVEAEALYNMLKTWYAHTRPTESLP